MSVRWRAYAATLLALAGGAGAVEAQTIRATLGDSARVQVAAGTKVRVPIILDLTAAGGRTLAQLLAGVTWGTNRLTYDSVRVVGAAGLTVQVDATSAGSGSLALTADWGTPLSGSATLLHLWFTAGPASGGARVALSPTAATSGTAEDILGLLRPEGHDVCAAFGALWGDVNGTGSVNITDAQQIARWTTGLVVGNAPLVVRRGDVTALNGVNIVDAQQIARWATGLSATAPRINAQLLEYPSASTIVVAPTTATVTEGGATTIVATVRDSVNNSLAGCYPVTWSTSNASVATVSSAGIVTAVAPGAATITAASGSLTADATITVGARATTLAALSALTQNGTAGGAVATLPSVKATDVRGDPVAGVTVTFAVASGGGSLGTAAATTGADGIATLDSWTLGTTSGSNTLTATASGLTGSPITFTATGLAGAASQLALTTQPSGAVSGVALTGQPVVELRDQYGNTVTSSSASVTAAKASGSGTLSGTATVNAVNGVATFSGLTLSGPGSHTLRFTSGSLEVTSSAFAVTQAAASLVVTTQPGGAVSGAAFTTQPVVEIRDHAGLVVTTGSGATLSMTTALASGSGTLGGTKTVGAVAGVATFTDLLITGAVGTKALGFSATGLDTVTSSSFTLSAGAAAAIAANSATTQSAMVGTAVSAAPSVVVTDGSGNAVSGVSVTFAVASGGGSVTGASATTDASGVATVGSWTLGTAPGANTLTATSGTLSGSPVTFSATGTQDTLTVGGSFTANAKGYDGTTAATGTTTGLTLVGVASGDTVTLGSVTLAFATAAAGTDKTVSITGLTLGGAQAYRYVVRLAGAPTATASITPAASSVTVTGSTSFPYTGAAQGPATADVTGSTGAVTYSYAGTGSTTYGPSATAPTNTGTYAVTATVAADANYAGATSAAYAFTITPVALTVTAGDQSVAYGTPVATVTGAGSATLAGFVAGETAAVVSGTVTYTTTYTATTTAGTAGVTITPVVTGLTATNYSFTPVAGAITVTPASQSISFGTAPTVVVGGTGTVSATASSGLGVSFASTTTGVCTVAGTTVTGVTAGDCTIQATQAGNGNYAAAPAVTQTFAVGLGSSSVTVTGDTLYTYSGSAQGPTAVTRSGSTGELTWSYAGRNATTYGPSATRPTNAGEYSATATVAADANYAGATSAAFAFRIAPAAQAALALTVEPTSVAVGATAALGTTGGSGTGAVSYAVATGGTVCSVSSATLTALTAGTCTVTATKAADANYLEATSAAATVTVYGTAAALAVSREPAGAVSGVSFTTQPRIEVRDAGGRLVTSSTASVTAAIASGTGTLTGTTTVSAVAGVATFTNLVITGGGAHTLAFTATDLTSASSSSFTVTLPEGATVSKVSAAALGGYTGNFIANAPAVRVLTSGGAPIPGVTVSWSTDAGSLVQRNSAVTDTTGTAALLGWRLGGSAGTQTASATVTGRTPVDFAATATAPPASQFNIEVRYLGTPPSAARQAVFAAAAARWSELIVGDLVPVTIDLAADPDGCYPALDETVDDLVIFVTVDSIDGPGDILGGARPCLVRGTDTLPVVGEMIFDEDDLPALEADGQFDEVILHEMGHVLGLGSLWDLKARLTGAGTPDPYFTGATARAAFIAATGITGFVGNIVPVESSGGPGTQDSHWRETVFDAELMTGYLDTGANPLSATSAASLRDLGYVVNDGAADVFSIGAGLRLPGGPRRQLRELPFDKPIRLVDRAGRIVRTIVPR